jgi:hypothetical protein
VWGHQSYQRTVRSPISLLDFLDLERGRLQRAGRYDDAALLLEDPVHPVDG